MSGSTERKDLIARRLREARKLAGLSQGQAAKMLGLHRPAVSEIEGGNRNVSAIELARFAEIYDVSATWLTGEGADQLEPHDERIQLAFRELKKLKPNDIDKLMRALAALRGPLEEK